MKKYLLPEKGQFYKANLHCHSTVSDGKCTPEELKKVYMEMGYSVIAYTDHDILIPHPELTDENFVALNGCELAVNAPDAIAWRDMKTCHFNCIAVEPDNWNQVCYHKDGRYVGNQFQDWLDKLVVDESKPDFYREYSHEGISAMMKEARDSGFFVVYNHPHSSLESYPDYMGYENMHALEICNGGGLYEGYYDYCPQTYDDILKSGRRILAVAGDDTHKLDYAGWAFTMIKAEKLEYRAITDALLNGNFYTSQGPRIDGLWVEDDIMHITCPGADKIVFTVGNRREWKAFRAEEGEQLTHAEYRIKPDHSYIRVTVYDKYGKTANTNAYFVDEMNIFGGGKGHE